MLSHEIAAVVRGLTANEHLVVLQDLREAQQVVVVILSGRDQVVHFLVGYFTGKIYDIMFSDEKSLILIFS